MRNSFLASFRDYLRNSNRWLLKTPERSLNQAYEAALKIREMEETHFGGNRVSFESSNFSKNAQSYFLRELKNYLGIIKVRMAEFKLSSSVVQLSSQAITEIQVEENSGDIQSISVIDKPSLTLKKLRLIDEVLARYEKTEPAPASLIVVSEPNRLTAAHSQSDPVKNTRNRAIGADDSPNDGPRKPNTKSLTDKTGVLPRSILETVDRIKRELDPEAEQEVVQNFRASKLRTITAMRLILLLIIVPLLTQQVSKNFIIGPIVDHARSETQTVSTFLNTEMEEEALDELQRFEQRLRFEILIGKVAPKEESEIVEQVKEKAAEIEEEYRRESADAIKNVFSDLLALIAFALVVASSRREIEILKRFLDQLIYGLSDSAKAFIIILFTDMFVGFHSPHGWEVLLEGLSKHFGLPADRNFIFLFIATFPVILDTIFKYWIFRYLNRVSPSAVATYKNMNE